MELVTGIFTAFGLSASAGLNAYIPLLVVGLIGHYFPDLMKLNQPWDAIANPWIILLLCFLIIIEMLADKVPAVNHINDLIQTFIRPAAGAIAFAASANVVSDVHPVLALTAGLLISGTVHLTKSGVVRPIVTATTGGTGNVPVSIAEDITSTVLSIIAVIVPVLVGTLLVVVASFIVWRIWLRMNRETS